MEPLMPLDSDQNLLDALLESWDRNNTILLNLLHAIPQEMMESRALPDSPSIGQMFTHIHYVRLVLISENAPEFAREVPAEEWKSERDISRILHALNQSGRAVREAVEGRMKSRQPMNEHYDHPILFLQHMIWHEGYHHGQIKLAVKAAGRALSNDDIGPGTWGVWMDKS